MLWVALVCAILGSALFVAGLVLYTNGAGVAPVQRTSDDPTGVKRAKSRVEWRDLFGRMRQSISLMMDEQLERSDRLMSLGSLCVLAGLVAWFAAALAFITGLL